GAARNPGAAAHGDGARRKVEGAADLARTAALGEGRAGGDGGRADDGELGQRAGGRGGDLDIVVAGGDAEGRAGAGAGARRRLARDDDGDVGGLDRDGIAGTGRATPARRA